MLSPHYCYYKIRSILLIVYFKEKFLLVGSPYIKNSQIAWFIKNALCDFSPFGAPQGNGQNALLLGKGTVAETKKVRYSHSELYIVL